MGGGDVSAAFTAALDQLGTALTHEDLEALYPPKDPAVAGAPLVLQECKFFELFETDPAVFRQQMELVREQAAREQSEEAVVQALHSNRHHPLKKNREFDFRLTAEEKAKLACHGLVVSTRLAAESFAEIYYRLYVDDLPVFVTADSVLHAWHRSFDAFLAEVECNDLATALVEVLERSSAQCRDEYVTASSGPKSTALRALRDVELFLTTALSLLQGEPCPDVLPENVTKLAVLWSTIKAETTTYADVFSSLREVDFSQFKPRGHYTKSTELQRYFRAMIWLGTVDFRIAGGEDPAQDLYQLQCAALLVHVLQQSEGLKTVQELDATISSLIADGDYGADSLSPSQLAKLLPTVGDGLLSSSAAIYFADEQQQQELLAELQQTIVAKGLGTQLINGHPRAEAPGSDQQATATALPTSFSLLGQHFVWSSFIFSRLVFDHVVHKREKQKRRIPSAVDVAFTLFANDAATGELVDRMRGVSSAPDGSNGAAEAVPFRDGIPFASNLLALRQVLDQEFSDLETESTSPADDKASVSTLWLKALRALSRPSPNAASTFHSDTWARRQMNTQIASFTQLRHDSVLYAKQSYTMGTRCEYADGAVEPQPLFWSRMRILAERTAHLVGENAFLTDVTASTKRRRAKAEGFFTQFAKTMETLEAIAVCQAQHEHLSNEQSDFLKAVMEERRGSGASRYLGWYPRLFYRHREDSGKRDVLVTDVHTDVPSIEHGDPGGVLHLGVGDPLTGFFVVNGVMYAGPVFSSYEFTTPMDGRLADEEFEKNLPLTRAPQWAQRSYLC